MIGGGLYVAHEVLGLFTHEDPGGSVTPGGGDTRPATMDAVTARVLADRIAVAFYGDGLVVRPWEYDEDAAAALMVPLVTDDVRLVMNEYGERGPITSKLTLAQAVAALLDAEYRDAVNANYAAKGITIRF